MRRPMHTPFLNAQHYHDQAESLRKLAAAEDDARKRASLREAADGYDRLCRKLMKAAREAFAHRS